MMTETEKPFGIRVMHVDGISCLDCAQKFEKAVGALPGAVKASLNTMTGKLTIDGQVDLEAVRRLGKEENYTITLETQSRQAVETVLQVDGISCLDCAQKFEKAVGDVITSYSIHYTKLYEG